MAFHFAGLSRHLEQMHFIHFYLTTWPNNHHQTNEQTPAFRHMWAILGATYPRCFVPPYLFPALPAQIPHLSDFLRAEPWAFCQLCYKIVGPRRPVPRALTHRTLAQCLQCSSMGQMYFSLPLSWTLPPPFIGATGRRKELIVWRRGMNLSASDRRRKAV